MPFLLNINILSMKITHQKGSVFFHISFGSKNHIKKLQELLNYRGNTITSFTNKEKPRRCLIIFKFGYSRSFIYENEIGEEKRAPEYYSYSELYPLGAKMNNDEIQNFIYYNLTEKYENWLAQYVGTSNFYWQLKNITIRFILNNDSMNENFTQTKQESKIPRKRILRIRHRNKRVKRKA